MQILCWDKPFSSSFFLDTLPNLCRELFTHRAPWPLITLLYGKRDNSSQGFSSDYTKVKPISPWPDNDSLGEGGTFRHGVIPWDKGHLWSCLDSVDRASAKYCWDRVGGDIKVSFWAPFKALAAADSICSPWWQMMPWSAIQSDGCRLPASPSWNFSVILGCISESGCLTAKSGSTGGLTNLFRGNSTSVCVEMKQIWTETHSHGSSAITINTPLKCQFSCI